MRIWALVFGLASSVSVYARTDWFTVVGDPANTGVDTVQIDPQGLNASPGSMNMRVNRPVQRLDWSSVPYRSYESRVVFDCTKQKASYVAVRLYAEPLWQGVPREVTDYSDRPKPMLFLDMTPNPASRIVRAACRARSA